MKFIVVSVGLLVVASSVVADDTMPTTYATSTLTPTSRPISIMPTTTGRPSTRKPYEPSFNNTDCDFQACKHPECQCLSDMPPNGLQPQQIPQFVTITFEGAVSVTNFPHYATLFNYKNPNGCPIHATYFVSHVDTNYKLVHELYRRGNEIGVHSISKEKNNNQDYWRNLDYEGWKNEFGGQRKIISKYADVPEANIKGARAPNLQTAGNITISAFADEKFEYDCSNPSRRGIISPFFPYTFDYGFQRMQDCQVQPCLKRGQNYKGFWDVPMNDWDVKYEINNQIYHRECALLSGCIMFNPDGTVNYHPTADQMYELFEYNFDRFYYGNRAPFPMYLSEEFMQSEPNRVALKRFIEDKLSKHDVVFASIDEVLEWMKSPSNLNDYIERTKNCKPIKQTKCGMEDDEIKRINNFSQFQVMCDYKNIGELNGLTKRMVICDDLTCPQQYPWINRIDN